MKKSLSFILFAGLLISACTAKKNTTATVSTEPTDAQLTAVKTKIPDATMDDLKKGHDIYYGACTNCHGPKNVTSFEQDRLQKTVTKMAAKSKLSDADRDAVWKYALAVNLAAKK